MCMPQRILLCLAELYMYTDGWGWMQPQGHAIIRIFVSDFYNKPSYLQFLEIRNDWIFWQITSEQKYEHNFATVC